MVWPQRFLANCERASKQWLGLLVAALADVELRQVIETRGGVGMVRPQRFLVDGERALEQQLGDRVISPSPAVQSELGQQQGYTVSVDLFPRLGMLEHRDGVRYQAATGRPLANIITVPRKS